MKASLLFLPLLVLAGLAQDAEAVTPLAWKVLGGGYSPGYRQPSAATTSRISDVLTLTLTVPGAKVSHGVAWHNVDGLIFNGSGTNPQPRWEDFNFFVTPARAGLFVIPAFDIRADDGQTFHVAALSFRVVK